MPPNALDVKPFVWAGLALTVPSSWETGQLDDGYALLEYDLRPVLEIKTAVIRGRFSFRRHLNQLARQGGKRLPLDMPLASPAAHWPEFPAEARVQTFAWQAGQVCAKGLLYYCRRCRRATLIQFFDQGRNAIPLVLPTFRDHAHPSGPTIAIYDIQATLPARFGLTRFRFDAGQFEIVFGHSREIASLWRWSPADILLERQGGCLDRFARSNGLLPAAAAAGVPRHEGREWLWREKAGPSWRNLLLNSPRSSHHALRIWYRQDANRLLAVKTENIDHEEEFERICRNYGIISENKATAPPVKG